MIMYGQECIWVAGWCQRCRGWYQTHWVIRTNSVTSSISLVWRVAPTSPPPTSPLTPRLSPSSSSSSLAKRTRRNFFCRDTLNIATHALIQYMHRVQISGWLVTRMQQIKKKQKKNIPVAVAYNQLPKHQQWWIIVTVLTLWSWMPRFSSMRSKSSSSSLSSISARDYNKQVDKQVPFDSRQWATLTLLEDVH